MGYSPSRLFASEAENEPSGSLFSNIPTPPVDEPFSLNEAYIQDPDPQKVNLGIGVYRTEDGHPWPLRVVQEAEKTLYEAQNVARHEYLSIQGDKRFVHLAADLVFGFGRPSSSSNPNTPATQRDRIASIQTVSGTGANRLGAELLARTVRPAHVWIPNPTWANHHTIWELAGVPRREYPYYNATAKSFDFDATVRTLSEEAKANDVVVLHACAHNPTGADPTREQWKQLATLCAEKKLIPFFDLAYQGFASGDADTDAWAIRHFLGREQPRLEFCVAQSFSKNFGLYGQRAGALHVVTAAAGGKDVAEKVLANLSHLVRGEYSMAPRAGSEIVRTVLDDEGLRERWYGDLQTMSRRIQAMRRALYEELIKLGTPGTWNHILSQIGMFTYVGLSEKQVLAIRERHHIYMLKSGRISISGLSAKNARYVAEGIDDVVRTVQG